MTIINIQIVLEYMFKIYGSSQIQGMSGKYSKKKIVIIFIFINISISIYIFFRIGANLRTTNPRFSTYWTWNTILKKQTDDTSPEEYIRLFSR